MHTSEQVSKLFAKHKHKVQKKARDISQAISRQELSARQLNSTVLDIDYVDGDIDRLTTVVVMIVLETEC